MVAIQWNRLSPSGNADTVESPDILYVCGVGEGGGTCCLEFAACQGRKDMPLWFNPHHKCHQVLLQPLGHWVSVLLVHQRGVYALVGRGVGRGSNILRCHLQLSKTHATVWILKIWKWTGVRVNSTLTPRRAAPAPARPRPYDVIAVLGLCACACTRNFESLQHILCIVPTSTNCDKSLKLSHHLKRNVSEMILNQGVILTPSSFSAFANNSLSSCWLTNL